MEFQNQNKENEPQIGNTIVNYLNGFFLGSAHAYSKIFDKTTKVIKKSIYKYCLYTNISLSTNK